MKRILGIDTGTNSLGWAIVDKENEEIYHLIDKGVNIFQEGVKIENGIESSKASERTEFRSRKRLYYRKKCRKIRTLRVLSNNNLCPHLSQQDLSQWRLQNKYPKNEDFILWQRTDDKRNINPYYFRFRCLNSRLNLDNIDERYILGRAFYHLAQRRGFLSNRKETTKENDGTVKQSINELSQEIQDAGCKYLGEYFYKLYSKGEKIRKHYTAREEHYLKEFKAICEKQNLSKELTGKIEKAIFTQLPLKSQKGSVGTCTFEKKKTRCPSSHPYYEEFRMLSFINNIKVKTPEDKEPRFLTNEEKETIKSQFYRISKKTFEFEDIAKKLAGKNNYGYYKTENNKPYLFNYSMDTSIAGCPVITQLRDIFGEKWNDEINLCYTLKKDKSSFETINDIWHALFFYSDESKLKDFAKNRLQLDEDKATKFSKIHISNDYAALSLKAIRKILPYLQIGLSYSHAVFLAKLDEIIPHYIWEIENSRKFIINEICKIIDQYDHKVEVRTLDQCIKDFIKDNFNVPEKSLLNLYHPSMIEPYPQVRPNDLGEYQLGSPRTGAIKNPMAMHSLFRLRKIINLLLKEKEIDSETEIHIEFARELNDANKRKALADYQRDNKKQYDEYSEKIKEQYNDIEPSDRDLLKYKLWEEQKHICIYTGEEIGLSDFLGDNPKYDIEHTIPRSAGGDSTQMNLTLCNNKFNREIKGTKLPSELANYDDILARIEVWKNEYESLDKRIHKLNSKGATTKDEKDRIIQKRNRLKLERDYWHGKYERYTMTEVPEGFSRRQGAGIGLISKYARLYLKSVFPKVYTVKGIATSDFRKIWGIQDEYNKKERDNHVHHCIDAITIACIGKTEYDNLARYYHDEENHEWYGKSKAVWQKPWPTFVQDIKDIQNEILVAHYTTDNMPKQDKRFIKLANGKKQLTQGDTARGSLHNETFYGAIKRGEEIKYVLRKELNTIKETDIPSIVDDIVREKVQEAVKQKGFKTAMSEVIWMNEEKHIPIKKVRCYANSVNKPLHIKSQRDISQKEYKRYFYVTNDHNYMLTIYIGKNDKGKEKREYEIINLIDAAAYYKKSNDKKLLDNKLSPISKNSYPLFYNIKLGTIVLLYEKSPFEIWEDYSPQNFNKRLFVVYALDSAGRIFLVHHECAKQRGEQNKTIGSFKKDNPIRENIRMSYLQFNALIEGCDFEMNDLGKIKRLR
jgi:CRISPR-associated endonuclease Csn1